MYPGLKLYETQMKKYAPKYEFDEVAIQGWESAALFVQGVKMAGNNLTQQAVINADNSLTSFTAGGLIAPINWKDAGHTGHAPPYCSAFIKVVGNKYVPTLNTGEERDRLLPVAEPEQGPGVPAAGGHADAAVLSGGEQVDRTQGARSRHGAVPRIRAPGVPFGCTYALVAICLCLTYQATGVFNFALRRAGVRVGVHLRLPDRVPELVRVRGVPGHGRRDGTRSWGGRSTA